VQQADYREYETGQKSKLSHCLVGSVGALMRSAFVYNTGSSRQVIPIDLPEGTGYVAQVDIREKHLKLPSS
jgi:hypothetical protein